jgi:hypothetical protein
MDRINPGAFECAGGVGGLVDGAAVLDELVGREAEKEGRLAAKQSVAGN